MQRLYGKIVSIGGMDMALTYNKLWKMLIDKGMNKTDLRVKTGMSQATLAKLSKGENITTEVLERICKTLNCEIGDIVELKDEDLHETN
jgi:DNA-binding Xre family transcriptional regulator